MRVSLIINAGSGDALEAIREGIAKLRAAGHEVTPRLTFERGDARCFAREASASGAELVVAAGGDGTINEVANGLHDARVAHPGVEDHDVCALGIIPLGTANDFAGALGIPTDPQEALLGAVSGVRHVIDLPRLNGEGFVNVSTGGVGAEATEEASDDAKRLLGPLAYFITGVRKFVTLRASTARFTSRELIYDGPFLVFAVGNSRRTGGGNFLTPRADPSDGLLDLCIVKEVPRRELLGLLPDLRTGNHLAHPAVIYRQVPALSIVSAEELSVNVDGEPVGGRELNYEISPHRLTLSLP